MFKRTASVPDLESRRKDAVDQLGRAMDAAAVRGRNGRWGMRLEQAEFDPELAPLIGAFNANLEAMESRQVWYEAILDAVPFLLSVTDLDMNWTFINKPLEQLAGKTRREVVGHHCGELGAPSCTTDACGVATLRRGDVRSNFQMAGMELQIDTTYIVDPSGQRIGHMEVIQDTTALVRASEYQQTEAQRVADYLGRLATGDLSFAPEVSEGDQHTQAARANFVQIAEGLQRTLDNLRALIGSMQGTAVQVAEAGAQIRGAAEQSAFTTQGVAATIQHVASDARASSEAAASVTQIAESGRSAVMQNIDEIKRVSTSVGETVARTGANIEEMGALSNQIGVIVETIDEIADQTNLLALNAAIEAARAGEHGRGFAVVAEEVRKLAERSRQATREISGLIQEVRSGIEAAGVAIDGSTNQVSLSTELATAAVGALTQIADAAARSTEQAQRIASGAGGVAATTEEMSAQSEELTASAQTLADLSAKLRERASEFRLHAPEAEVVAPRRLRPAA
jgi:methyl-accepting chemotaxis protein